MLFGDLKDGESFVWCGKLYTKINTILCNIGDREQLVNSQNQDVWLRYPRISYCYFYDDIEVGDKK